MQEALTADRTDYFREYKRKRRRLQRKHRFDTGIFAQWAEGLTIPTSLLTGRKFQLHDFQRQFLSNAMADGIRESALCIARKNGKTALIALLLLSHLVGPFNRRNWRAICVSLTGQLAGELRIQMTEIAEANGLLTPQDGGKADRLVFRQSPLPGFATGDEGARVDFLNADKSSGHAVGADLVVFDESGLLTERKRQLWMPRHGTSAAKQSLPIPSCVQCDV